MIWNVHYNAKCRGGTMKLNERALMSFASDSTPPDKSGFLFKKGEVNRGFQKRYFVLRGNMLFYFEKQQDREPVGVIVLENCHVELSVLDVSMFAFQIVFHGTGTRKYVLASEDKEDMESWMKKITHAGHGYMKTMVEDFEKRLENLKQAESEMAQKDEQHSEKQSPILDSTLPGAGATNETKAPLKNPFSRAKHQTLPATHNRVKVLSADSSTKRWSLTSSLPSSQPSSDLPEVDAEFHDLINLSERTDFFNENAFHSPRHFSINDFTPPSFSELKNHEAIEDQTMFDVKCVEENTKLPNPERFNNHSFANRIKDFGRVNSERRRQRQHISTPKTSVDDLFLCQKKNDSRTTDECPSSQFQHLHNVWGAAIWVKVHEYEIEQHAKNVESDLV